MRALQFGERFWIGDKFIKVPIYILVNGFKIGGLLFGIVIYCRFFLPEFLPDLVKQFFSCFVLFVILWCAFNEFLC